MGIVGKYFASGDFSLSDSYISVIEAMKHAGIANHAKVNLHWISAEDVETEGIKILKDFQGKIVVNENYLSSETTKKVKEVLGYVIKKTGISEEHIEVRHCRHGKISADAIKLSAEVYYSPILVFVSKEKAI